MNSGFGVHVPGYNGEDREEVLAQADAAQRRVADAMQQLEIERAQAQKDGDVKRVEKINQRIARLNQDFGDRIHQTTEYETGGR